MEDTKLVPWCQVQTALKLGQLTSPELDYYSFLHTSVEAALQKLCRRKFVYNAYEEFLDATGTPQILLKERPVWDILALWEDRDGNYGQSPGAFAADKLLTPGVQYALKIEGGRIGTEPAPSESGIVVRLENSNAAGVWSGTGSGQGDAYYTPAGAFVPYSLGAGYRRTWPGSIKVHYVGGYPPDQVPYDLRRCVVQGIAQARQATQFGQGFKSESHEGYAYTLDDIAQEIMKLGSVQQVISQYREFVI